MLDFSIKKYLSKLSRLIKKGHAHNYLKGPSVFAFCKYKSSLARFQKSISLQFCKIFRWAPLFIRPPSLLCHLSRGRDCTTKKTSSKAERSKNPSRPKTHIPKCGPSSSSSSSSSPTLPYPNPPSSHVRTRTHATHSSDTPSTPISKSPKSLLSSTSTLSLSSPPTASK